MSQGRSRAWVAALSIVAVFHLAVSLVLTVLLLFQVGEVFSGRESLLSRALVAIAAVVGFPLLTIAYLGPPQSQPLPYWPLVVLNSLTWGAAAALLTEAGKRLALRFRPK